MIFQNRYGRIDRLLHRLAFRARRAQQALSEVEDLLFRDRSRAIRLERPVLVSGLPRSGTTLVLNLLHETGRFATHTYREMPFVLCPLLWRRFSERFETGDEVRERAHGDGIRISSRSPEAFEEMVWKHFWPAHYREDRILPWTDGEERSEFDEFLDSHMRKMILLRSGEIASSGPDGGSGSEGGSGSDDGWGPDDGSGPDRRSDFDGRSGFDGGPSSQRDGSSPPPLRYLSKNNLNIARLAALPRPLRDAVVLVPFREPLQHAASMLRQHVRFLRIHSEDPFTRRYMAAIGHHEFGAGLKPVDFGGWMDGESGAADPRSLEFWLRYWVSAYRHVLRHATASTRLVSYDRLISEPRHGLGDVARFVGLPSTELSTRASAVRSPRLHEVDPGSLPSALWDEARILHNRLEAQASVHSTRDEPDGAGAVRSACFSAPVAARSGTSERDPSVAHTDR